MHIPAFEHSPYFLVVLFSIAAGVLSVAILLRKRGLDWREIGLSTLLISVCLTSFSMMSSYLRAGSIRDCGFDSTGAIAGLVFGLGFSLWLFPRRSDQLLGSWAVSAPLMYGLSKIACFLVGCCHGFEYNGPFAVYYGDAVRGLFPIQLIEAIVFCGLFAALLALNNKLKSLRLMQLSVWASLALKFLLDFLRDTHVSSLISANQWMIIILALGFGIFCHLARVRKLRI